MLPDQGMKLVLASVVLLSACAHDAGLDGVDGDAFWDDTEEDTGTDDAAAAGNRSVALEPGATDDAELVKFLPVGRTEASATRKVALRVRPPTLAPGDRLIAPAEVQVTTRCDIGQTAPGCNYSPTIRAQLLLTGNPDDTTANGNSRVIATQTQSCTKNEHHCMFVFRPGEATIDVGNWPCVQQGSCVVNLVLWAWDPAARSGGADEVIVGGNDGDFLANHRYDGDLARLVALRERNLGPADRHARESSGNGSFGVNTNANPEVVYSHRLAEGDLVAGETFLVEALVDADVANRARFSTELIVSHRPDATDGKIEKLAPASVGEQNGVNCSGACRSRKVTAFRVKEDVEGPVFVNVVVKSAVPGGGSTRVTVDRSKGWVRSVRYAASLGR